MATDDDEGAIHERHVPLLELLEIRPVEAGPGRAVFAMTVAEKHLRTLGILHGGATATLLDTAMGYAAVSVAPEAHHAVTVQINVNYVRPAAAGERLVASGHVVHTGRKTAVATGEVRSGDRGALVATGSATFMFLPVV